MVLGSTLLLWLVSLSAAALSCVVSLVKLIDRRRQRLIPSHGEFSQVLGAGHDLLEFLPRRRAPVFASTPTEKVARYRDVAPIIRTGDVLLFSGRTFLSYIIRIFTFSTVSHVGLALRDEGGLWVVDSCEGKGVTKRLLADEIKRWPGQWYFAEIATGHRTHYSRKSVAAGAQAMIGQQYGWIAIAVQAVLHAPVLRELAITRDVSRNNTGLTLCLAINYGARHEIVDAVRSIARRVQAGELAPDQIEESTISDSLDTAGIPDPDLLIRTAGEMRVSNFLLWQISYAELYVTDVLWPDFRKEHLNEAVRAYAARDRRFGGIKRDIQSKP